MQTNTYATRVAASVRAELARKKITQGQLADALGMTQPAISRRVSGQLPFDVDEIQRIAEFLSVPVTQFMTEDVA
jgi:transcriptional regulator with XRE-family HTH domain